MSDVTLKATVTKNGQPFLTNLGLTYHNLNDAQLAYLGGKMKEITDHLGAPGKKIASGDSYSVTLSADGAGAAGSPQTWDGLSANAFRSAERHIAKVQSSMIDDSEKSHKAQGKSGK